MRGLRVPLVVAVLLAGACAGPPPVPDAGRDATYQSTPDGHYRVRRGDSLYAIAFRYGLDWRDIAAWNGISAPYVIRPDQLLKLGPPGAAPPAVAGASGSVPAGTTIRPAPGAGAATTRPLETPQTSTVSRDPEPAPAGPPAARTEESAVAAVPGPAGGAAVDATKAEPAALPAVPGSDPSHWLWPAEGRLLSRFQAGDPSRKGIDIGGEAGRPIKASADGVVVYSGSGLIGYGELIIIKHSDRMLSAYAHNSRRLVAEGQSVAAGSQIAEMGTNDRNQAVLHFEIRLNGSPVDPLRYLPSR